MAIGFIGLGIMGEGMAGRLITQNSHIGTLENPLIVWNRTKSKSLQFQKRYNDFEIIIANTPKEVIEQSSITFCMLSTPEASKEVFEAKDGILAGVSKSSSIVDCATLAESDMIRMNNAVVAKGG